MLFSKAGRESRMRRMGLMRGKDENQVQLRARLAKLVKGPVEEDEGGGFATSGASCLMR